MKLSWKLKGLTAISLLSLMTGCQDFAPSNPVIFGQTQKVGLSIGVSQINQTPQLSLGYDDFNIAILPTVARADPGNPGSAFERLGGNIDAGDPNGTDYDGTYSVIGQFDVQGEGGATAVKVGLEKFFATGLAARVLAEGFACSMSRATAKACNGKAKWTPDPN